jgi:hypothetical protein
MSVAISELLTSPALGTGLAREARLLVRSNYDWVNVGRTAARAVAETVRAASSAAGRRN